MSTSVMADVDGMPQSYPFGMPLATASARASTASHVVATAFSLGREAKELEASIRKAAKRRQQNESALTVVAASRLGAGQVTRPMAYAVGKKLPSLRDYPY